MSMTMPSDGRRQPVVSQGNGISADSLRDVVSILPWQETRYKDGGAHWYRSSAVLLHYHRFLPAPLSSLLQPADSRNYARGLILKLVH